MTFSALTLKRIKNSVDWRLLLFLVLFLNVKLGVKVLAVILIYLLQFNFRFAFSLKNSRLPLFYPLIIILSLACFIIGGGYGVHNYTLVLLTGIGFWLLCILAIHQVKLSVEQNDVSVLNRTITVFFIINAIVSLVNLGYIVWQTGAINPYTYQGQNQKYFIGTGDYIKGLTFDTSTTNAVLNAFGVIYFLAKKNALMLLTCVVVLLLTGSNFTNIILLSILIALFIFYSDRVQKSLIVICIVGFVVFMAKISPQNNNYVAETMKNIFRTKTNSPQLVLQNTLPIIDRPDSLLNAEEKRQKIAMLFLRDKNKRDENSQVKVAVVKNVSVTNAGRIFIPQPDINSAPYQNLAATPPQQKNLVEFVATHKSVLPVSGQNFKRPALPGKVISMLQTLNFFRQHPGKIFAGDGIGNFSSKLAFRVSGLGWSGGYPASRIYINHDFLVNHLDLYLNFFTRRADFHSLINSPYSVYDQLLTEYGIIGIALFFVFYLGFFLKNFKQLTYGLPILFLTAAVLFIDYWFEQLSVMVFFELIILLNFKESSIKNNLNYVRG